jgi:hypothetical protein
MKNRESRSSWWEEPITLATVVIAVATMFNVAVSICIGYFTFDYTRTTKNIYKASNRPYLGVIQNDIKHDGKKSYIISTLKNVGNVPATIESISHSVLLDTSQMKPRFTDSQEKRSNLLPQQTMILVHEINLKAPITESTRMLEIEFTIKYKGINEDPYEDYEKYGYDNAHDAFIPIKASFK